MNTAICGRCEYCDKNRMRCILKRTLVGLTESCDDFFNITDVQIYNQILSAVTHYARQM